MAANPRKALRKELRAARRAIDPAHRAKASKQVAAHADAAFHLHAGQRIALYAAMPEELDATPLIELALERGCKVHLPRIDRRTLKIHFMELGDAAATDVNHLGIAEPRGTRELGARWLDLVFLPLVGFDACGMRLGMGGGYYDRTFAYLNSRSVWRAPKLIGIAYASQRVAPIEPAAHDVKLDAVITEDGIAYKHIS